MKIDFHSHSFPEAKYSSRSYSPQSQRSHDLLGRLPAWDLSNVSRMNKGQVERYVHAIRVQSPLVNDYVEACSQSPERFKAFATVQFPTSCASQLERTLNIPGFVGALITSNVGDKYLHTPEFFPFWEEVERRKVPVFMHPKPPPGYQDDDIAPLLAFPADTTLSTMKLLYSGLFERCPNLILILAHLGGTLPYLARRIDLGYDDHHFSDKYRQIPHRPSEYMHKLYFDTALGWHKPAFDCACDLVGIDHLVYGSDYFMQDSQFMRWTNEFLEGLPLSKGEKEKIYHKNAERFLKL